MNCLMEAARRWLGKITGEIWLQALSEPQFEDMRGAMETEAEDYV